MAELLEKVTRETEAQLNPFRNGERARLLEANLPPAGQPIPPNFLWALAAERLTAGRTLDAIARYDQLEAMMTAAKVPPTADVYRDLRFRQAVAHLRRF